MPLHVSTCDCHLPVTQNFVSWATGSLFSASDQLRCEI